MAGKERNATDAMGAAADCTASSGALSVEMPERGVAMPAQEGMVKLMVALAGSAESSVTSESES